MQERFPSLNQIATGNSPHGNLHVVGIKDSSGHNEVTLFAGPWQSLTRRNWLIPSHNQLGFSRHARDGYIRIALASGHKHVHLVGLGVDHRVYLAGSLDETGVWQQGLDAPIARGSDWRDLNLANGNDSNLHVISRKGNEQHGPLFVAAWQDTKTGAWHDDPMPIGSSDSTWTSTATALGGDGRLQVIGMGANNEIHLAAWQDWDGTWHAGHSASLDPGRKWRAFALGKETARDLQIVCLDFDRGKLHLAAYQVNSEWKAGHDEPLGSLQCEAVELAAGRGIFGSLEILCLGADARVYRAAWRKDGVWHDGSSTALDSHEYRQLALAKAGNGDLHAIGLTRNGNVHVVAWQDPQGNWHQGHSLSQECDAGGANRERLNDVSGAFELLPERYTSLKDYYAPPTCLNEYDCAFTHYQGMARYERFYLLPHNRLGTYGFIDVIDTVKGGTTRIDTPEKDYNHPGGCQVVGDFLAIEVEKGEGSEGTSIVRFYWLGALSDIEFPMLMPGRFVLPQDMGAASAVAITDVGPANNPIYIMALYTSFGIAFFESKKRLDSPNLGFTYLFTFPSQDFIRVDGVKHGPDNMYLLTDTRDNVYLIALGGEVGHLQISSWADLYQVDFQQKTMHTKPGWSKPMVTSGIFIGGVHFRYGAGAWVKSGALELYGSPRNVDWLTLETNKFSSGWHEWQPILAGSRPFAQLTPVAALSMEEQLDLFAVCPNDTPCCAHFSTHPDTWQGWNPIQNAIFSQRTPIAAISREANSIDLYAIGTNKKPYTAWRNPGDGWQGWKPVAEGTFTQLTPIAAVSRGPHLIDLFAVGMDGRIYTAWWRGGNDWNGWKNIKDHKFQQLTPIAAVSRDVNSIDIFAVGTDGRVYTNRWEDSVNHWQDWVPVGDEKFPELTPIAGLSRDANSIELFAVGTDGRVRAWRRSQGWMPVFERRFKQLTPIAATSGAEYKIGLFAVGQDGHVCEARWSTSVAYRRDWASLTNKVFPERTPIAVTSRVANEIDLFAVDSNGIVNVAWWDKPS